MHFNIKSTYGVEQKADKASRKSQSRYNNKFDPLYSSLWRMLGYKQLQYIYIYINVH